MLLRFSQLYYVKNYLAKKLYAISFYPLIFLGVIWAVFLYGQSHHINLAKWGVLPRELKGVKGIVTSIFIHGDTDHIVSNSFPLLILGMMLFFFYKKIAKAAFFWIWLVSGLWLWLGGRNNLNYPTYHLGASTLIYGLATFLFFSGVFRKHLRLMAASALVVFLYGSIMWGVLPLKSEISWEGHLFGAISGLLVAYNYRKEGPQYRPKVWDEEEEDEANDEENNDEDSFKDLTENRNSDVRVIIHYIPNKR
jgi:membrane associated rhomboid family serine protease